jgi:hypothetical protein
VDVMEDPTMDVVVSFDTTGSMYGCLAAVRKGARALVERLFKEVPGLRMGVLAHGDYTDAKSTYLLKKVDLTDDVGAVLKFIKGVPKTYGGDAPEAYEYALHEARGLAWREGVGRVLVMIGDEVPHKATDADNKDHLDWETELAALAAAGVKIYGVQAQAGKNRRNRKFYEALAEKTGGAYVPLENFKNVSDMLLGIALNERGEEHLSRYAAEVARARRMDKGLNAAYAAMLGRELTAAEATGVEGADGLVPPAPRSTRRRAAAKARARRPASRKASKATAARVRARKELPRLRLRERKARARMTVARRSLYAAYKEFLAALRLVQRRRKARAVARTRFKAARAALRKDTRLLTRKRLEAAGKVAPRAEKSSTRKALKKPSTRKALKKPSIRKALKKPSTRKTAKKPSTRKTVTKKRSRKTAGRAR